VHYFAEQSLLQSPNLLNGSTVQTRQQQVFELNALVLGKLIQLWRPLTYVKGAFLCLNERKIE
ncbi:hypothetical protein ACW7EJ_01035, partial [Acinetobacter soli]